MTMKHKTSLLKLLGLTGVVLALNACSSEPAPWVKNESPWDSRRSADVEAPAADTYKADLEMAGNDSQFNLDYEAAPVESFAPEVSAEMAAAEMEPAAMPEETAPAPGGSLMDVPAAYYTVQLMASVDIDRVYRFAETHQISTQYIVPTVRDGVTWHVLLLDVYSDYSAASAAKDEIAGILGTQPWIRKVGSVQKLM